MKKIGVLILVFGAALSLGSVQVVQAQATNPYLGQIMWTAANYCPNGWSAANGQLLPIAQNQALFALLGTSFGGNGQTTFALPDLRGRVVLAGGQGSGLTNRNVGAAGGTETVALTVAELPAHTHGLQATARKATQNIPTGKYLAKADNYRAAAGNFVSMGAAAIGATGGSQPHENMPPFVTLTACIAMQGVFPSP
jgi:microcystin-dependent protein